MTREYDSSADRRDDYEMPAEAPVISRRNLLRWLPPAILVPPVLSSCMSGGADPQFDTTGGDPIDQIPTDYRSQGKSPEMLRERADAVRSVGLAVLSQVLDGVSGRDNRRSPDATIGAVTWTNAAARDDDMYASPRFTLTFDRRNRSLTAEQSAIDVIRGGEPSERIEHRMMVKSVLLLDQSGSLPRRIVLGTVDDWVSQGRLYPEYAGYYDDEKRGGVRVRYLNVHNPASEVSRVDIENTPWDVQDPINYELGNVQDVMSQLRSS